MHLLHTGTKPQIYEHTLRVIFRKIQSILSYTDTSYLFSLYQIDFLLGTSPDAWLLSAVSAVTVKPDLCIWAWLAKHTQKKGIWNKANVKGINKSIANFRFPVCPIVGGSEYIMYWFLWLTPSTTALLAFAIMLKYALLTSSDCN